MTDDTHSQQNAIFAAELKFMGRFPVHPSTEATLERRMVELGIRESDFEERFVKGGGPGGQKINKTASCVQLVHQESGIEIRCQRTRSQALNRYHARRELCDKIEERLRGAESARKREQAKKRRQKAKRSKRAKEKLLVAKRHTADKKLQRKKPDW